LVSVLSGCFNRFQQQSEHWPVVVKSCSWRSEPLDSHASASDDNTDLTQPSPLFTCPIWCAVQQSSMTRSRTYGLNADNNVARVRWTSGDQGGHYCRHSPVLHVLARHTPHRVTILGKTFNFTLQHELHRHRNLEKCAYLHTPHFEHLEISSAMSVRSRRNRKCMKLNNHGRCL
jgi:hypothetical protein